MALEMKSACEKCDVALAADAEAFLCSYECTFCPACACALQPHLPELRRRASPAALAAHDCRSARKIAAGTDLSRDEAEAAMEQILSGALE